MRTIQFFKLPVVIVFAGLGLLVSGASYAQAPPGPLPAPQSQSSVAPVAKPQPPAPVIPPRTTILGAWKLNRDESDDTRNRRDDSEDSNGGRSGGYGGRRGGIGGGYPGGGHGGYGGRGESDEERAKMHELLTPPTTMTLSMTGAEVDLLDDRDRKRAFITDGRKLKKSKDDKYQEIAAKFDGNRLITEEKDPRGNKMSRTFELSEDGRQLYETLHMTVGRNNASRVIRFVYDIPVPAQTGAQPKQ
jgi:hypothetical protein